MKTTQIRASGIKFLTVSMAALLAACTVGPDYKRPEVAAPTQFRAQVAPADAQSIADLPWWGVFDDKALQKLIAQALANNYDLAGAVARIEQARALVGVARSEREPQLGYQAYAEAGRTTVQGQRSVSAVTLGAFGGLLNAAWEFDVWGRIKRSTESAQANLLAQEDVRRGVLLSLVTDVAAGYFRLIELDRELAIAEDSSRVYGKTLDLFTDRFKAGKDSELPVHRTQAAYDSANANTAAIRREIEQQENALSVLLGASPQAIERGRLLTDQVTPATPVGATTDLLLRRPDILQAEQVMVGANAEIGVAVANFYPRVGLSALAGGVGAGVASNFYGFGVWNVAAGVAGPILTGGRLEAIYDQRRAFWDETVARYHKTVLVAFQETSDALVAQQTLAKQKTALESQIQALQHSVDTALLRYDSGRAAYFEVLEAEQQLFPAQAALAQTQRDQLLATVNLYKALGGGWKLSPEQWVQPN
ncbi:MAG: efflux transporter outer membrane subunit [Caulobacteraceae bacterium]|nr:efflux transporter outer membrane subunit [Caulobacteraceae bacterium]